MKFHSKSVVSFGQVLNALGGAMSDHMPIPAMLDIVKDHFTADAVMLSHVDRRGRCLMSADSANGSVADAANEAMAATGRLSPPRVIFERYQYVSATEPRMDRNGDCVIWICRDRAAPHFDNEENALAGIVIAQITRTLDIASRLDSSAMERALYSDALECLHVAVVITDETGRVARMSGLAKNLLSTRNGLQIQAGKLRATNVNEDRSLQALLRGAAAGSDTTARGLSLTRSSGLRTLGMVVRAVAAGSPLVCVYLRDFDSEPKFEGEIVRQILDLTPAEAAMTRRLASGLSLEDAAIALDISRNTARAHLRSIFSKNGITRQTELVRMVLNSAALLGAASGCGASTEHAAA